MALDLAKLKPAAGKGMPARKYNRRGGPNPFLEGFTGQKDPKVGTLLYSYENDKDFDVTVAGEWIEDTIKKGPKKGQPIQRLIGDAAEVESMLRSAANSLGIGVSVKMDPPVDGLITIHYLGKERASYGPSDDDTDEG